MHPSARPWVLGLSVDVATVSCVAVPVDGGPPARVVRRKLPDQPAVRSPSADPAPPADMDRWIRSLLKACDTVLRTCSSRLDGTVVAVGVAAGPSSLLGLGPDGLPLIGAPADPAPGHRASTLREHPAGGVLHDATGVPVGPRTVLASLMAWADADPGLCATVSTWVDLKALVLHHLTGRYLTDASSASETGLLDLGRRRWHEGALELAGITPEGLPELVEPDASARLLTKGAEALGLSMSCLVVAGAGAGASAVVGDGVTEPGQAVVRLDDGARMQVLTEARSWGADDLPEGVSRSLVLQGLDLVTLSPGRDGGTWDRLLAALHGDPDLMERAGRVRPGCDGLLVLPWGGTGVPGDQASGMVLGLRPHHGPEHLVRATFEGACLQLAGAVRSLSCSAPVHVVVAAGAAVRRPWQLETLGAMLELPVVRPRPGGPARGAAAFALLGCGAAGTLVAAGSALSVPRRRSVHEVPPADPAAPPDRWGPPTGVAAYRQLRAALPQLVARAQETTEVLAPVRAR